MASIVNICNIGLSHIGSSALVSSIDPPDGSVEAQHCKTFYDQCRTAMLEAGAWAFALKRAELAEVTNLSNAWYYAYALPSDCMSAKRVLKTGSTSDNDGRPFGIEGETLYTNESEAVLLYVRDIVDTTKFTPGFVEALGYLMGSYLAGPIIEGFESIKIGDALRQRAMQLASAADAVSANASMYDEEYIATSIKARG